MTALPDDLTITSVKLWSQSQHFTTLCHLLKIERLTYLYVIAGLSHYYSINRFWFYNQLCAQKLRGYLQCTVSLFAGARPLQLRAVKWIFPGLTVGGTSSRSHVNVKQLTQYLCSMLPKIMVEIFLSSHSFPRCLHKQNFHHFYFQSYTTVMTMEITQFHWNYWYLKVLQLWK